MKTSLNEYYNILGVTKDSSKEEIKKSFRLLALKYHPDVCNDEDSEVKFQKIINAYQIIVQDNKVCKKQSAYVKRSRKTSFPYPQTGKNKYIQVFIKSEDLSVNATYKINYACHKCSIQSGQLFKEPTICLACNGRGRVGIYKKTTCCPMCDGKCYSSNNIQICDCCYGSGKQQKQINLQIQIPSDIRSGDIKQLQDKGHHGKYGGLNGDLFVQFVIKGK